MDGRNLNLHSRSGAFTVRWAHPCPASTHFVGRALAPPYTLFVALSCSFQILKTFWAAGISSGGPIDPFEGNIDMGRLAIRLQIAAKLLGLAGAGGGDM